MRWRFRLGRLWGDDRAAVAVVAALALMAMVALVGAAVDLGVVYAGKAELQNAADAAATAGAAELLGDPDGDGVAQTDYDGARQTAIDFVESNQLLTTPLVWNEEGDLVEAGQWSFDSGDFAQTGPSADPADLDAVRVAISRPVETFFARAVGLGQVMVGAVSVGYLGCAGDGGQADLPLAINAAVLDGLGPDSDIVLSSENAENGQWTSFDVWPTNTNSIGDFLDNPEQIPRLNIGDSIHMNNGEIANLFGRLETLFNQSKDAAGQWPVLLPVVQWTSPQNQGVLVGFVHFVITEVRGPGGPASESKRIIGYWKNDVAMIAPGARSGGACYGARASRAALIE